jgi:hypothetical protein
MLIVGEWVAVRTAHTAKFFELLGGGLVDANWDGSNMNANRLAILPGLTHYANCCRRCRRSGKARGQRWRRPIA